MKKIAVPAFVFIAGVSIGVWSMVGGGIIGGNDALSNSDTLCNTTHSSSTTGCTGGAWTTWDLATHTQTYNGFIYTTYTTSKWYSRPHKVCGYKKTNSTNTTSAACTMTRTDNGAPDTGATTENIPATCENC